MSRDLKPIIRRGPGGFAILFLIAAISSAAEDPPAASADSGERGAAEIFDVVTVVSGHLEERVGEIAGTASVVDRQEMDRRQVQSAADLVRYEPGVSASGEAGRFGFSSYRIRGVDGNRVAIEVDDVPVPDAFSVGSFASSGRGFVEPELLRSVEILRGPASALHGGDALGGVVALVTRRPGDYLSAERDAALETRIGVDSRDGGRRLSLLGAAARGRWQLLAMASVRRGHEVDNRGATAPDPARTDDLAGFARVVRLLDRGLLELTFDRQRSDAETDVRHLVHGPGQFSTTERLQGDDRRERSRVSLSHRFGPGARGLVEATTRLHWSEYTTRQETVQERAAGGRAPAPTLRERSFELGEELAGAEWKARSVFTTGAVEHRLTWGAELGWSRIEDLRDGTETDLSSGVVTSTLVGERLPVRDFPRSELRTTGAFLADDMALGDGRWRLQPAVRFDRTSTRGRADALYREDFPDTEIVDSTHSSWTPKVGLTRDLGSGHSAYLQYAEGFRAPPFYDVNIGLRIAAFDYEAIPNPDLRPERSRGVELGWRFADARLSAHLALYDNRFRDLIESRVNLGRNATGTTLFQSLNRDRARIRGVEGRLRIDLERLVAAARGWTIDGAFSWSEGEDTVRRQPLNSVDPAQLTLGAAYRGPAGDWSIGLVGTWVASKRGEVDVSTADAFAPPGYEVLDLYAERRLAAGWHLRLGLLNAFDRRHWRYGRVRGVLADDPQLDFHTEPGRSLQLGLAWSR